MKNELGGNLFFYHIDHALARGWPVQIIFSYESMRVKGYFDADRSYYPEQGHPVSEVRVSVEAWNE